MKQPRYASYFDFHAQLERTFIHPGGEAATDRLLAMLPALRSDQTVLEIGCGRGATAAKLLNLQPCSYIGLDVSRRMQESARCSVQPFGQRARVLHTDLCNEPIPIDSEHIDAVIAESVVAILDPVAVLTECRRVLKVGGMLFLNDRLWSDSVSPRDREALNRVGRRRYGFPLAAENPATINEWVQATESLGLRVCHKEVLTSALHRPPHDHAKRVHRIVRLLKPRVLMFLLYDRYMMRRYRTTWSRMENWLMVFRKVA